MKREQRIPLLWRKRDRFLGHVGLPMQRPRPVVVAPTGGGFYSVRLGFDRLGVHNTPSPEDRRRVDLTGVMVMSTKVPCEGQ